MAKLNIAAVKLISNETVRSQAEKAIKQEFAEGNYVAQTGGGVTLKGKTGFGTALVVDGKWTMDAQARIKAILKGSATMNNSNDLAATRAAYPVLGHTLKDALRGPAKVAKETVKDKQAETPVDESSPSEPIADESPVDPTVGE